LNSSRCPAEFKCAGHRRRLSFSGMRLADQLDAVLDELDALRPKRPKSREQSRL
jgi:hypothetical protein